MNTCYNIADTVAVLRMGNESFFHDLFAVLDSIKTIKNENGILVAKDPNVDALNAFAKNHCENNHAACMTIIKAFRDCEMLDYRWWRNVYRKLKVA